MRVETYIDAVGLNDGLTVKLTKRPRAYNNVTTHQAKQEQR